jgi:enoyl-CoA hydratase/carnithine racemase
MEDLILYEQRGRVVILTLNDAKARNPLGDPMVDALVAAIGRVNADQTVSCVILTGAGEAFCSGGNIKDMRDRKGLFGGTPADMRLAYAHGIQRIPLAMYGLEAPTIGAVNGPAIGAGCDLAMMCDLRVAADTAVFAESFLRVRLISGDGGAWFLPRVVGISRAYEMAFTGNPVPASLAAEWGMTSRVVAKERLMDEALELAASIARQPPQALRLMKRLIRDGHESTLAQNLEQAALMQAVAQHTDDHREAVAAFLEKRPPAFKGK